MASAHERRDDVVPARRVGVGAVDEDDGGLHAGSDPSGRRGAVTVPPVAPGDIAHTCDLTVASRADGPLADTSWSSGHAVSSSLRETARRAPASRSGDVSA
jgi:hypothetical protein